MQVHCLDKYKSLNWSTNSNAQCSLSSSLLFSPPLPSPPLPAPSKKEHIAAVPVAAAPRFSPHVDLLRAPIFGVLINQNLDNQPGKKKKKVLLMERKAPSAGT